MEEVGCGTTKHKVCLCITDNIVNSELLTDLANVQLDLHCITDNKPLSLSLSLPLTFHSPFLGLALASSLGRQSATPSTEVSKS